MPKKARSGVAMTEIAGPAMTVAMNVTGATPLTFAVTRCVPAVVPTVQMAVAAPFASVSDADGFVVPEPALASHCTTAPAIALPAASVTTTLSGTVNAVPTVPVCSVPLAARIAAGVCVASVVLLEHAATATASTARAVRVARDHRVVRGIRDVGGTSERSDIGTGRKDDMSDDITARNSERNANEPADV